MHNAALLLCIDGWTACFGSGKSSYFCRSRLATDSGWMTGKPEVILKLAVMGRDPVNSGRKVQAIRDLNSCRACLGARLLRRIRPKSERIDCSRARNTRSILLTHSKMYPAMLLYRKFSTFTGFQLAGSVRVHPRHLNWQGK